ncbi:VOC family protein [Algoriphagus sp. AGSA1]|uniref:VOC family protein n=1 Tax=Algoriphagus sp. AGSA1 TaxID=2907213 RepID=UPI001F430548|nr:VOC family protein [Algoriphagus sp. AGSA1]MCE7053137.1 VOC family protein [Algoriphagus sp. AGSA1]
MIAHTDYKAMSAVFITFSGNCKKALTFYQSCFGGVLRLKSFENKLPANKEIVVSGSLLAEGITIHGSDLVHNEGRKLGNYISIFLGCKDRDERRELIEKLLGDETKSFDGNHDDQKLIELTDPFDVRWVLGISD